MKTITICSSANFYQQVYECKLELEAQGYRVLIPLTAQKMHDLQDYEVSHYKTWFGNADDYDKKATLMRSHFDEVAKSDAILVLNNEKHGIPNYIGGNVLIEMALAFYLKKPIFIFNEIPEQSPYEDEILGMMPIALHGNAGQLTKLFPL